MDGIGWTEVCTLEFKFGDGFVYVWLDCKMILRLEGVPSSLRSNPDIIPCTGCNVETKSGLAVIFL